MIDIVNATENEIRENWPNNVAYKGSPIFAAYIAEDLRIEITERIADIIGDRFTNAQGVFLGYSSEFDTFVAGWDAWHADEGIVGAWVTLEFYNDKFHVSGNVYTSDYMEGFYDKAFFDGVVGKMMIDKFIRLS